MRSATPKLLHPLCGRPMIAWPVAAAREAGAGEVVVVDGPERTLAPALDGSVEFAVQEQPRRERPTRSRPPRRTSTPDATVIVLNGDVPLITRRDDHGARSRPTSAPAPRRRSPRRCSRTPAATAASSARPTAPSSGSSRRRRPATPPSSSSTSARSTPGIFAFDGGPLLAGARARSAPTTPRASCTSPTCCRSSAPTSARVVAHRDRRPDRDARRQRPRRAGGGHARVAQRRIHERHMLAGVTIVDPDRDGDRRRGRDRPGHGDRAVHEPARRRRAIGDRLDDRAAARR